MTDPGIQGDWEATKVHCACGYHAVWTVTPVGEGWDEITVVEQPGAGCCGCVPNPCRKTHKMKRTADDEWKGRLGGKPIMLSKTSDKELRHMTTDGPMVMTRS